MVWYGAEDREEVNEASASLALIYKRARRPRDKSLRRATLFIRARVFLKLPP